MPIKDDLGKRMKEFYENRAKTSLIRRMPVAIRIDGKAFHTFTRGFKKPFDEILIKSMQETMMYLCRNIQGCVLGYTQSDEITLILKDYETLDTDAWFDYEIQKLCSISASMATLAFNRVFRQNVERHCIEWDTGFHPSSVEIEEEESKYRVALQIAMHSGAMFDARCFNIPIEEVTNLIYWRQLDATRNSIQMVAQANFSHKQLQGLNSSQLQDKLMLEKGINWNDFPIYQKRGSCCIKGEPNGWALDVNIPIFRGEGREYIERLIKMPE